MPTPFKKVKIWLTQKSLESLTDAIFRKTEEYAHMRPVHGDISSAFTFHLRAQIMYSVALRLKHRQLSYHHAKSMRARCFTLSQAEAIILFQTFGIPDIYSYEDAIIANMNTHIHQQLT